MSNAWFWPVSPFTTSESFRRGMVPKAGKVSIIVAQPCQAPPEISPRVIPLCAATLTLHDGRRFMKGANFGFTSSSSGI